MVQRRDFIKSLSVGSLMVGTPAMFSSCTQRTKTANTNDHRVEKVIQAMLTMQRASWEHGVAMQAVWEWGDIDLAYLMARESVLRQADDGRLSVLYTDNGVTDPAASGEVVYQMGKKTGDEEFIKANEKMLDYLLNKAPRTPDGILHHTLNSPEIWVDSFYMAPPYLCVSGHPEEAVKQVEGFRKYLWNDKHQLYSHRWHCSEERFINKKFWGVGNGWVIAALARMIDTLPDSMSDERLRMIQYATETINGCLQHLRSDGLFHDIVDDTNTFVETNLSQMVAYGIFRGIKSGWLPGQYFEKALLMRTAAHSKVDDHGFVQGVCGAPWFNSQGRATEGQAFFILMEAAYNNL